MEPGTLRRTLRHTIDERHDWHEDSTILTEKEREER